MSAHSSLVTLAAVVITAFALASEILIGSRLAVADENWQTQVHPSRASTEAAVTPTMKPNMAPTKLDMRDEIAALERIEYALSEVGDGSTYVWRRWHGRLSGVVHPTVSFKDDSGKICRHLVVLLTTGDRTRKIEGIACRMASGRWRLEG
jgi:surface antigen